jgi:hypothetical protein
VAQSTLAFGLAAVWLASAEGTSRVAVMGDLAPELILTAQSNIMRRSMICEGKELKPSTTPCSTLKYIRALHPLELSRSSSSPITVLTD